MAVASLPRAASARFALVNFLAPADAYDRFMGRYSVLLAPQLADFAAVAAGQRVLDVGCGPGALTAELVRRLRADFVSAVVPSETSSSFAQVVSWRHACGITPAVRARSARSGMPP